MAKTGVLLINLGTPDSPEPRDVGKYLREFLMDPWVIDIPAVLRWFLVNVLIVPRRSHLSAALYRKIWTPEGSPLLVHTRNLADKVQKELGAAYLVRPAMRYGSPSMESALRALVAAGVDTIAALPLYPQYSLAATESSVRHLRALTEKLAPGIPLRILPAFYNHPAYLDAVAQVSAPHLHDFDRVLFSFHGLPERQVKKTDATGSHCLNAQNCCEKNVAANADCYRAQSYATAAALATRLKLPVEKWEVGFQSRLGRTPWIQPFSDQLYQKLPSHGARKLAVLTPSFVADCLETLEEVQMRGEESFLAAGGQSLKLVPSLNDHPAWVRAVAQMTKGLCEPSPCVGTTKTSAYQPST